MNAALGRALLHRTPIRQLQLSSSKSSLRQSRTILRTMASANDADVKLDKSTPDAVSTFRVWTYLARSIILHLISFTDVALLSAFSNILLFLYY
jgi:hypothetical protein